MTAITLQSRLDAVTDRMNPLFVREVRRFVKSRHFIVSFVLLLLASWTVSFAAVLRLDLAVELRLISSRSVYNPVGADVFSILFLILTAPIVVAVPLTAFDSMAAEYHNSAIEMLWVTPMSGQAMVRGKLWAALLQMLLHLSAIVPFLSLSYLLQGISLISIVAGVVVAAVASTALTTAGLALGGMARSTPRHIVAVLVLLVGIAISEVLFIALATMREGFDGCAMVCIAVPYLVVFCIAFPIADAEIRPNRSVFERPLHYVTPDSLARLVTATHELHAFLTAGSRVAEDSTDNEAGEPATEFLTRARRMLLRIDRILAPHAVRMQSTIVSPYIDLLTDVRAVPHLMEYRAALFALTECLFRGTPHLEALPSLRRWSERSDERTPQTSHNLARLMAATGEIERVLSSAPPDRGSVAEPN